MKKFSLTLQEKHLLELRSFLIKPDGNESAAYLICGQANIKCDPWNIVSHCKLISYQVIPVSPDEIIESTSTTVAWRTDTFVRALKQAEKSGHLVAIVHSHPAGLDQFSATDDSNEPDLLQIVANRNGEGSILPSLVMTASGRIFGRVWRSRDFHQPIESLRIFGENLVFHFHNRDADFNRGFWHRQALAFGPALNDDLRRLRIGIVGCGATGSATAMLLARLGVGQLLLVDSDIVDRTNLSRLHLSRASDADAMIPKVEMLKRQIAEMGLGIRVVGIPHWVGSEKCRDALKSCDLIFGCTDDNDGRMLLNRYAYFYATPVIDMGLAIEVKACDPPEIKVLDGRVTVIAPEHTCLICRGIVDSQQAYEENLSRANPEEYERRKVEAYVSGEKNPSPAVVTFTTEVATMAVNELLHRMHGFRGPNGATPHRVRKFHLNEDLRPGEKPKDGCPFCKESRIWGRGDVDPFLDRM